MVGKARVRPTVISVLMLLVAACGGNGDGEGEVTPPTRGSTATASPATAATAATAATTTPPVTTDPVVAAVEALDAPADLVNGSSLGKAEAAVVVEVFEDFQCPFCLLFTAQLEGFLISEFVEPGEVRLVFRNLPILGEESLAAAIGAHCAGEQNRLWEFKDALFLVQAKAGQHLDEKLNVGRFSDENLESIAGELAMDVPRWRSCVESEEAFAAVQVDRRAATDAGLRGTPGFIVNGTALPGIPGSPDAWRQVIEAAD